MIFGTHSYFGFFDLNNEGAMFICYNDLNQKVNQDVAWFLKYPSDTRIYETACLTKEIKGKYVDMQ